MSIGLWILGVEVGVCEPYCESIALHYSVLMLARRTNTTENKIDLWYEKSGAKLGLLPFLNTPASLNLSSFRNLQTKPDDKAKSTRTSSTNIQFDFLWSMHSTVYISPNFFRIVYIPIFDMLRMTRWQVCFSLDESVSLYELPDWEL